MTVSLNLGSRKIGKTLLYRPVLTCLITNTWVFIIGHILVRETKAYAKCGVAFKRYNTTSIIDLSTVESHDTCIQIIAYCAEDWVILALARDAYGVYIVSNGGN